jgi:hypothetical protein
MDEARAVTNAQPPTETSWQVLAFYGLIALFIIYLVASIGYLIYCLSTNGKNCFAGFAVPFELMPSRRLW